MEKENIAKELWLEVNCLLHMYLHKKNQFYGVRGTAESVNYHSFLTDGTTPFSEDYMRPYPANDGKWHVFYNPNNPIRMPRKR